MTALLYGPFLGFEFSYIASEKGKSEHQLGGQHLSMTGGQSVELHSHVSSRIAERRWPLNIARCSQMIRTQRHGTPSSREPGCP